MFVTIYSLLTCKSNTFLYNLAEIEISVGHWHINPSLHNLTFSSAIDYLENVWDTVTGITSGTVFFIFVTTNKIFD